ncbi:hypothetical protein LINGRAHAP2_LOCUS29340 [Linum grandiflorum]
MYAKLVLAGVILLFLCVKVESVSVTLGGGMWLARADIFGVFCCALVPFG